MLRSLLLALTSALALAADDDYARQIAQFQAAREAELKADDGWLTVVGLHWLKEGANRVGSEKGIEVQLPASAPKRVGVCARPAGGRDDERPACRHWTAADGP
jgi:hypothetical protein